MVVETIGQRLIRRFEAIKFQPKTILNVGLSDLKTPQGLKKHFPHAHIIQSDLSAHRLASSPLRSLCCHHFSKYPFASQSFDLIVSHLSLHHINALSTTMDEWFRLLKPEGMLMFSSYGPDTLKEVRRAWSKVDEHLHVQTFWDMHDLGDLMRFQGFESPVTDSQRLTVEYPNLEVLWNDLKQQGNRNALKYRTPTLTGKNRWQQMTDHIKANPQQTIPISYEIVYGHGWKPSLEKQLAKKNNNAEYRVSIDQIKRLK